MRQTWRQFRAWLGRPRMTFQDRVVIADDIVRCPNPIFLIGLHRSGTSLMRRVMNAHPMVACPPESFFISHYAKMLNDEKVQAGYRGFGNDADLMREDLGRKATSLHEAFRVAQGKQRWADKTPNYTEILPELKTFFPQAQFIMLYRHPFDVADSIKRRGWSLAGEGTSHFGGILSHMRTQYALQIRFEEQNPQMCFRSRYEDLMAAPQERLESLMQWLGEDFDPVQLEHHKARHNFGTEDPIARGAKGFAPSIGNWTSWSAAEKSKAKQVLGSICKTLEYDTEISVTGGAEVR